MTSNGAEPVFDEAALGEIEKSLPREQFVGFLEEYLVSAQAHLDSALASAAAGDLGALGRDAHKLISITGSYGIRRASVLARELETACKAADQARASRIAADLAAAGHAGCAALRARFIGT